MISGEITKEKICAFYASDYHFEMVSLPYIDQNLENKNEIIILTENDLENTIKNLLSKVNIKENKKSKILKLNWKQDDTKKIEKIKENINENKKITVFIKGKEKYINQINKNIASLNQNNKNLKIIDCYDIQEVGENLDQIMLQYNKILSTTGEKDIEKL